MAVSFMSQPEAQTERLIDKQLIMLTSALERAPALVFQAGPEVAAVGEVLQATPMLRCQAVTF